MTYTKEEIELEVLTTGQDFIPITCPGTCRLIDTFENDIVTYGRKVFCRRQRAKSCPVKQKDAKGIPVQEALQIDIEGVHRYDLAIQELINRKSILEAEIESLRSFA